MKTWTRRIRGALSVGVTWAFAWFCAGIVLLLVPNGADVPFPLLFALLGFLAGVTFSVVLHITEGRRRFEQMSLPRFAAWGAVGGVVLSVAMAALLGGDLLVVLGPVFALAGAGCAVVSLGLARRAENRELLNAALDADDRALS